jgi:hypothetical protein
MALKYKVLWALLLAAALLGVVVGILIKPF